MLRNYLLIAIRNVRKHKGLSAINVVGLGVGIACCLLVVTYVRYEWSFDQFHERSERLYRAWVLEEGAEDQRFFNTVTPIPLAPTLASTFSEVEHAVRISTFSGVVQQAEASFNETIHLADPAFFDIFDFPLLQGTAAPLAEANSLVLSQEAALRYFGDANPIGQTLSIHIGNAPQELVVTGVAAEVPLNSSIQFTMVVPWIKSRDLYSDRQRRSWGSVIPETYVLLQEGTDAQAVEAKFPLLVQQAVGTMQDGSYTIGLQPMTDIHLNPDFPQGLAPVSDPAYAYILLVLAALILSIACINVVILSVARSTGRTLEVGVRKVLGAERTQLMQQFWGESFVLTLLALLSGVLLAGICTPLFNKLAGTELVFTLDAGMMLVLAVLVVLLAWISGSYPALVLSGFRPGIVLKGGLQTGKENSWLRSSLMTAQLAFAVFLITSTLVIGDQLAFLQNKNLGFDKAQVVVIPLAGAQPSSTQGGLRSLSEQMQTGMELAERFKQELARHPHILQTGAASALPGMPGWFNMGYVADDGRFLSFQMSVIDPDLAETLGLEVVTGRDFEEHGTADATRGILVNETLAASYGWADPIGQRLPGPFGDHEIIGVVRDFHVQSLHTAIQPVVLVMNAEPIIAGISDITINASPFPKLAVRIAPDAIPATLATLENEWEKLAAGQPLPFSFLDDHINNQYRAEQQLRRLVVAATLLSIVIACLGLLALAALTTARRTKEIGVRKVLGASAAQVVLLLAQDLLRLILLAFLMATPVVYLIMRRWLQDFEYHIDLGPGVFLLAGILALTIALLTVSYQSISAAQRNPVDSLRYE